MKTKKKPTKRKKHMQPTTPTLISIVNQSAKVTDAAVAAAVPSFGKQIAEDYAPVWGASCAVEFVPKGGKVNGNVVATLSDTPDVEGALGYHDRDDNGFAYIKVFVVDGYDWRTTMSHEILEMLGDAAANRWADAPDGDDYAIEMCDAVESDTYDIDGLPASNFVYPAFFNPTANSADKLDHLGKVRAPFDMTSGGYQIKRTEPGKVSQVFAAHVAKGHSVHVAATARETKHGQTVLVIFGHDFPLERRNAKVERIRKRYAR